MGPGKLWRLNRARGSTAVTRGALTEVALARAPAAARALIRSITTPRMRGVRPDIGLAVRYSDKSPRKHRKESLGSRTSVPLGLPRARHDEREPEERWCHRDHDPAIGHELLEELVTVGALSAG